MNVPPGDWFSWEVTDRRTHLAPAERRLVWIHIGMIALVMVAWLVMLFRAAPEGPRQLLENTDMTTLELRKTPGLGDLRDLPVGKIVALRPQTARVLEQHQIDYCCKGGKTLAEACVERGIGVEAVVRELEASPVPEAASDHWLEAPLPALCDHIERRHHDYLRTELPRLQELIDRVLRAHGEKHPELAEVRASFGRLRAELEPHMFKEEQVLFPAIRQMHGARQAGGFPFGSVANPIRCMIEEHETAGDELAALRRLTGDFKPPRDACPTWWVMLDSLARLERDLHTHIHKENSILFPRSIQLEQTLVQ
jgi:regulator of cell morphogenesis and NO signaling